LEQFLTDILTGSSGAGAYSLVLVVLLLCGVGLPLPEDVALITGGFLVFKGEAKLPIMIAVAYLGILGGDSFAFLLGRRLGDHLTKTWPFRLIVTPPKKAKVEKLFHHYGEKIVMAARFMPGVRAVTYFIGGAAGMSYRRFVTFDGIAATVSAPVFVFLGYRFGDKIDWVVKEVRKGQLTVLLVIGGVVGGYYLARYAWRSIAARQQPPAPPALPPEPSAPESAAPHLAGPRVGGEEPRVVK